MRKINKKNLASAILGTALLGTTAIANMAGSCGANMKGSTKTTIKKGSCGANMKKGSCGPSMMKKEDANATKEMEGTMSGKAGTKSKASCVPGKCGSM